MRLAAFQMVARKGDVAKNLAMIGEAAAEASGRGATLLVAPELATTAYGSGDLIRSLAEPADGPQVAALSKMATANGITIVAGFAERAGERIYNSALLVEPSGGRAIYRKCHLYGDYERRLFTPGDVAPRIFELGGMKIGILICYDVEFPEAVRHLALAGAELVLVPTAQPDTPDAPFIAEKVVPVRAFENGIAIVYADHAGSDGRFAYAGRSSIALPDGSDGARAPANGSAIIVADYDPANFAASRSANPYLVDRRTDLFEAPLRASAADAMSDRLS
jgi:predicted amidohydrolase